MNKQQGIVQILIIILLVIIVLSLLGVNFKAIYDKITQSQTLKDNLKFIKNKIVEYYYKAKAYILKLFQEKIKPLISYYNLEFIIS